MVAAEIVVLMYFQNLSISGVFLLKFRYSRKKSGAIVTHLLYRLYSTGINDNPQVEKHIFLLFLSGRGVTLLSFDLLEMVVEGV